jgi:hypothetical protein
MAQANFPSIQNISGVQVDHVNLIGALTFQKPHHIWGVADRFDLMNRADHLKVVLGAVATYVNSIVGDTVASMDLGACEIDAGEIADMLSDATADICGQFLNAQDRIQNARDAA